MRTCACTETHVPRRIVLTGGPGAGKTAALELIRRSFCEHVAVLPEAAGILFRGGFPRGQDPPLQRAAQRAIYRVQRELENTAGEAPALVVCDRGTVDGVAYWPGPGDFWHSLGTTWAEELARYDAVLHMRTPDARNGYDRANPLRTESPAEARRIDERIAVAWSGHPRRFEIPSTTRFLEKAAIVLALVRDEVPACCRPACDGSAAPAQRSEEGAPTASRA